MEAGSGAGERTAANHFSSPGGVRSRHGIAGGGAGGGASESDASTRLENSMLCNQPNQVAVLVLVP